MTSSGAAPDLAELEERARSTGAPADWRQFADALAAESPGDALSILYDVSHELGEAGDDLLETLGLAVHIANGAGLVHYAEYLLTQMLGLTGDVRAVARIQDSLDIIARWRQDQHQERRFHELQLGYFTERIAGGRSGAEHYLPLAQVTLQVGEKDRFGSRLAATLAVLDAGLAASPDNERLLEQQIEILAVLREDDRLDAALSRLERVNPRSPLLQEYVAGRPLMDADALQPGTIELTGFLIAVAASPDAAEVEVALTELRRMVAEGPLAAGLRFMLACGLIRAGLRDACVAEIKTMVELAPDSYGVQANAATLYKQCGDLPAARRHAEQARQCTRTPEEAAFVDRLISSIFESDD